MEIIEEIFTLATQPRDRSGVVENYALHIQTGVAGGVVLTICREKFAKGDSKRIFTLDRIKAESLGNTLLKITSDYDAEEEKQRHALHPDVVRRAMPNVAAWVEDEVT